jgi:GT2 family glycosyltransferase/SAM-dependent methyltransferase/glycosyltransferase involved in cell wall biosynthesis
VSFRRRAAAPRLIEWTGERCVPWAPDVQVVYEHFHRYLWAARLVEGRRVLDLGSGEGFGAALLSETAGHVVGVDVDELTVEHSRLNYAGPNLEFKLGTAVDLSAFEDASFDAVVAFEIIEHVREQERLLSEVARILADDGILVISTPDRRMYGEARNEPNPFHERELALEEFLELLGVNFPHVASWGQRTITGSHLNPLEGAATEGEVNGASEFFIERAGDEWRLADGPTALYCVALASKAPLAVVPASSTLADCGIELVRVKERETAAAVGETENSERERARLEGEKARIEAENETAREEFSRALDRERTAHARLAREREEEVRAQFAQLEQRVRGADEDIARSEQAVAGSRQRMVELQAHIDLIESQLASASRANRRVEESVTWQAFQKLRGRLYGAIGGERSLLARVLKASLTLIGRRLVRRPSVIQAAGGENTELSSSNIVHLPESEAPEVSLIIPLYSRADLTRACLCSIREHTTRVSYEVILVDDEADAGTQQLLKEVEGARILRNEKNLGYLRSVNRGASMARGKWLVLFNNDTEVTSGWLEAMLDCANSAQDVGVVTPKFIYPDGSLNEAGGIIWRDGTGMNYGRGDVPDRFPYEYRRETDYGSAAALMVSADLWKDAEGFDERYLPMYYEDVDLCFEARERGLRVMYEPGAVVVHFEGATAGNDIEAGPKRYQEQNRPKFVAKWRHRLEAEHGYPKSTNLRTAADRRRGPQVLVVDHRVPMWDRDAGSLRIVKIMQVLLDLGARVAFMPANFARLDPYTRGLQQMGVEVFYGELDPVAEISALGPTLSTAILCRPHPASQWLDTIREFALRATVVYDTVDLHWLREARRSVIATSSQGAVVATNGSMDLESISQKAKALRELELAMMRATDATMVVTDREREQVEQDVPEANVLVMPTVHDVEMYVSPVKNRDGILFVGGFEHAPNGDAAVRLVKDVMPAVWRALGDVHVTVVGSHPPPEVEALASPLVDVTGWVEDLQPLLDRSRLMVAPLRYGAGMKGKITQALAVGLPVVTTSIGAEGLEGYEDECLLVADDAQELAVHVIRAYRDDELWQHLSRAGQDLITDRCSTEVVSKRLSQLLYGETDALGEPQALALRAPLGADAAGGSVPTPPRS